MSGDYLEKALSSVTLPLGDGVRFANASNVAYRISGIGVDFLLTTIRGHFGDRLFFVLSVDDKDSKLFESEKRFDCIRPHFKTSHIPHRCFVLLLRTFLTVNKSLDLHDSRVHFKIIVFDLETAYVGSANLTGAGIGMKTTSVASSRLVF